jgi:rod shape-determining protein MreD
MRDFIKVAIGIIIAFLFYTIFSRVSPPVLLLFNVLSLVVIYFAVEKGEVFGSCLGAACGLIQDYFSFGVYGVGGLAKTATGYLAGYLSRKIDIGPPLRNFFFLVVLIIFELILWALLYFFIVPESINTGRGLIFIQPLSTALLGSVVFFFMRKLTAKNKY